jgi:IclR family acetate operon transcriptional repressor
MPVKRGQSATRVLTVFENVAAHQPINLSDLATMMELDKSTVHRALLTLGDCGWIRVTPGKGRSQAWQVDPRIQEIVQSADSNPDLRRRVRPVLQTLRDSTGETVGLSLIERGRFVIGEVLESRKPLRVVLTVGSTVPARSATGRAILPHMARERQLEFLGGPPDQVEAAAFAETLARGYATSRDIVVHGYSNIAAPIFNMDGAAVGALLVSGPNERLAPEDLERFGKAVATAAAKLSRDVKPR